MRLLILILFSFNARAEAAFDTTTLPDLECKSVTSAVAWQKTQGTRETWALLCDEKAPAETSLRANRRRGRDETTVELIKPTEENFSTPDLDEHRKSCAEGDCDTNTNPNFADSFDLG